MSVRNPLPIRRGAEAAAPTPQRTASAAQASEVQAFRGRSKFGRGRAERRLPGLRGARVALWGSVACAAAECLGVACGLCSGVMYAGQGLCFT